MGYNQKMFGLGSKRSIIREIFEYSKTRAREIGADRVFDFSLGNPSVPAPKEVDEAIRDAPKSADCRLRGEFVHVIFKAAHLRCRCGEVEVGETGECEV